MSAGVSFGALLRRYRLTAGLSQQELAERAGLSPRGVSDLERGARHKPYPETTRRLAAALGLDDADRARFIEAAASERTPVSASASRRNPLELPRESDAYVSREHEIEAVMRLLADSALVTIAGPGGAGKTRLAMQLLRLVDDAGTYGDGIELVELAPLMDESLFIQFIAQALDIRTSGHEPPLEVMVRALRSRQMLLVLDNCEHLIETCAAVARELLRGCPRVRILTTSREPLAIVGEVVYRIPPLQLPTDNHLDSVSKCEAGRLFALRARTANRTFMMTETNAAAIGEICRRLDGLPLAIELTAARLSALEPVDIASRIEDLMRVATDGPRDTPSRQRTLEATLDWSYALLDNHERTLFQRLSVFAGGFSLSGAEAMSQGGIDALHVLPRLVAKSMVQFEPQARSTLPYRLLEPVRQFAHARLVESGELQFVRRRHAEYVLAVAEAISYDAERRGCFSDSQRLNPEADNLRVALSWALDSREVHLSVRLGASLWTWWIRPDRQAEGRSWLERILSQSDASIDPVLRARVMVGLGFLCIQHGYVAEGARLGGEVRQIARAANETALDAVAGSVLGAAIAFSGDETRAECTIKEAVELARTSGVRWVEVLGIASLAILAYGRSDITSADALIEESLRMAGGLDAWSKAVVQSSYAEILRGRGDFVGASEAYERTLALFRLLDPHGNYAPQGLLHNLGYVALATGEAVRAAGLFIDSADIYVAVGTDRHGLAECLIGLACVAVRMRQNAIAARLFSVAEAELERLGAGLTPANRAEYQRGRDALHRAMKAKHYGAKELDIRSLSLEDALHQARVLLHSTPGVRRRGAVKPG